MNDHILSPQEILAKAEAATEAEEADKSNDSNPPSAGVFGTTGQLNKSRPRLGAGDSSGTNLAGVQPTAIDKRTQRAALRELQFGPTKQVKWATYATQANCLDQLHKKARVKKTTIMEVGLALALEHFEKHGNFKSVDVSFGTDDPTK